MLHANTLAVKIFVESRDIKNEHKPAYNIRLILRKEGRFVGQFNSR